MTLVIPFESLFFSFQDWIGSASGEGLPFFVRFVQCQNRSGSSKTVIIWIFLEKSFAETWGDPETDIFGALKIVWRNLFTCSIVVSYNLLFLPPYIGADNQSLKYLSKGCLPVFLCNFAPQSISIIQTFGSLITHCHWDELLNLFISGWERGFKKIEVTFMYNVPVLNSQHFHDFFQIIKHWLQKPVSSKACLSSEMMRGISHFRNFPSPNVRYYTISTHKI